MKLHIIVVAYERPIPLRILIDSFLVQTDQRWELTVVHDGPCSRKVTDTMKLYSKDKRIFYTESIKRYGCYGHPNRAAMLSQLKGEKDDFVLITNDDNYYVPIFVEMFLKEAKNDIGIVYCDMVHSHVKYDTEFTQLHPVWLREKFIDMGAFIVRLSIAQENGFNNCYNLDGTPCFSADGKYAEECNNLAVSKGLKPVHIKRMLFVHN
jgi:GT2 family glycosyltransferase